VASCSCTVVKGFAVLVGEGVCCCDTGGTVTEDGVGAGVLPSTGGPVGAGDTGVPVTGKGMGILLIGITVTSKNVP